MLSRRNALISLGILRVVALRQKERQRQRARKAKAYLKMTKSLKTDFYRLKNIRMDETSFFKLLRLVHPIVQANQQDLEETDVVEQLLITLKYLATGCSLKELTDNSDLTESQVLEIILMTCKVIFKALKQYIQMPSEEKEWLNIAESFEKKWNFSHCAGSYSARHIVIDEPIEDGDKFLNHKNYHSVILAAVFNACYEFLYFEFGFTGGSEDLYTVTSFFENMIEDSMNLPKDSPLPGTDVSVPYVFITDNFYLIENLMRTYGSENLSFEQKIFNYRLSRAKRVSDNAFGVLYERFGVLQHNIYIDEDNLNSVGTACCALHNYLIKTNKDYIDSESLDREDEANLTFQMASWRRKWEEGTHWNDTHPLLLVSQGPEECFDSKGILVREKFTKYFNNEGKLPFQEEMVNVVPEFKSVN